MTASKIFSLSLTILLCWTILLPLDLAAEEIDETLSSVYLMLGRDDINNNSLSLGSDLQLKNYQHIMFSFSQDQNDDKENKAKHAGIGFGTNPDEVFSIETNLDSSEQTSDLTILNRNYVLTMKTTSINSTANIGWNDWQFGAGAKSNNIETYYSEDNKINMHSNGIQGEISYYGFENYFLNVELYSSLTSDIPFKSLINKLTLSTDQLQRILKQSIAYALTTTSPSITAKSVSFSVGRGFNWGNINYTFMKSESIELFNESLSSTSHFISSSISLTKTLDFDALYTYQNDSENNTVQSINLGLTYTW